MAILDKAIFLLFLIALGALPFLIVNWFRYMKGVNDSRMLGATSFSGIPLKSVIGFIAPILAISLLSGIMTSYVRTDVIRFLSEANADSVVKVENEIMPDPKPIIEQLRQVSTYAAHHTHTDKVIHVIIEAKGQTLALDLGRDSGQPNEYWVFYPCYRFTSMNEIGRITTNLFDSYK